MKNNFIKNNCQIYQKSTEQNMLGIKDILKDLGIEKEIPLFLYQNTLNQTTNMIVSKWLSGRKYSRTLFIQTAFENAYPIKYTKISLYIDAMINILDDILDEPLNKSDKMEYLLEFLRVFSVYNSESPSKKIQKSLEKYFNKLITLAIAENFYQQQLRQEKDASKIVRDSANLLICRGRDIDIFIEIALLEFKNQETVFTIKEISRIFRALNILRKDIKDIKHDKENNIETIVTLALSKDKNNFLIYINSLLDVFSEKTNLIMKSVNRLDKKSLYFLPIYNFNQMIQEEKEQTLKIVQSL